MIRQLGGLVLGGLIAASIAFPLYLKSSKEDKKEVGCPVYKVVTIKRQDDFPFDAFVVVKDRIDGSIFTVAHLDKEWAVGQEWEVDYTNRLLIQPSTKHEWIRDKDGRIRPYQILDGVKEHWYIDKHGNIVIE